MSGIFKKTLVFQSESKTSYLSNRFRPGLEVFQVGDTAFEYVIHNREYEGMKILSSWRSGPISISAESLSDAVAAAKVEYRTWCRAIFGSAAND